MQASEIVELVQAKIGGAEVVVEGEGCSFSVAVTSDVFEGLSRVDQQKKVLAAVTEQIASGELHAITVKTFTKSSS
ncbi:MAG: BolA family transcriptional regulator [Gammaproteobacteria bacterium]|nr:MAG: BolA family transcriptional regulator [Gammaproteobacteria bacterium]RLA18922.1 MAG: BolA family transcriptional regulator [Gammaproteobacteria bacterium]